MLSACLVCALSSVLPALASKTPIRGVPNDRLQHYSGNHFTCAKSGDRIPTSKVNDEVCDCADGTDEPGTLIASHASIDLDWVNETYLRMCCTLLSPVHDVVSVMQLTVNCERRR